ncbi:MAG: hypothetical protein WC822_02330 [Candidatus Paceibacterota bacterium]|jgi:hypothetical protein
MGSTKPQVAQADVPDKMFPYVSTGFQYAGQLMNNAPKYTMTDADRSLMAFGQNALGSGGMLPLQTQYYNDVMGGKYLTPDSNPFMQGTLDAMSREYMKALGLGVDQISSQFALAGHPMSSGALAGQARQYMTDASSQYQDNLSKILMGNYGQERSNQQQLFGQGNVPLEMASVLASMANMPRTLQEKQFATDKSGLDSWMQMLNATPLGQKQYGPSEFSQNAKTATDAGMAALMLYMAGGGGGGGGGSGG